MFKQLALAYNTLLIGRYRADLIALNPKEWENLKERYVWYEEEYRISVTNPPIDLEKETPKWIYYKQCVLVFKPEVPIGKIYIWRMEPQITFMKFDLENEKYVICKIKSGETMHHISLMSEDCVADII